MRLSIDPSVIASRNVTAESLVLGKWYDANPAVQRLWGIRDARTLRVVVSIAPTPDGDDVYQRLGAGPADVDLEHVAGIVALETVRLRGAAVPGPGVDPVETLQAREAGLPVRRTVTCGTTRASAMRRPNHRSRVAPALRA